MKHYLFLDRDGTRVPVAGPYDSDDALSDDLHRIDGLLRDRDLWTDFDARVRGSAVGSATRTSGPPGSRPALRYRSRFAVSHVRPPESASRQCGSNGGSSNA